MYRGLRKFSGRPLTLSPRARARVGDATSGSPCTSATKQGHSLRAWIKLGCCRIRSGNTNKGVKNASPALRTMPAHGSGTGCLHIHPHASTFAFVSISTGAPAANQGRDARLLLRAFAGAAWCCVEATGVTSEGREAARSDRRPRTQAQTVHVAWHARALVSLNLLRVLGLVHALRLGLRAPQAQAQTQTPQGRPTTRHAACFGEAEALVVGLGAKARVRARGRSG
ncbi:hypothetical protein DFH06DRAFT_1152658 [Mycena polygramma]|nr:hypothetical protein DFH06DRAFT_1152658 [Mycena polygramma]